MDISALNILATEITEDRTKTVGERIQAVLALRTQLASESEDLKYRFEAACFSKLLGMVKASNENHEYDIELFQLYTLLAESYEHLQDFRRMKPLAEEVLRLMEECDVSYQVIELSVPRIIDALKSSVYNHDRYRLLSAFLHAACDAASDDDCYSEEVVKERMRQMLNLRGLLDPATRPDILDADLMIFISYHIPPEEFGGIMDNPKETLLKKDPVEYTLRWEEVYYDVTDELDRKFAGTPRGMGFCIMYWPAMADLLRKKYGIEWRSPSLMNPRVMFD
ncbi:MAG: hypothetical protein ACI3Y2_02065 [Candidatus Egerieousia sp.]